MPVGRYLVDDQGLQVVLLVPEAMPVGHYLVADQGLQVVLQLPPGVALVPQQSPAFFLLLRLPFPHAN